MYRDVIVTTEDGSDITVRVEGDMNTSEISDVIAKRLAFEFIHGYAANDVVCAEYCRIAPPPGIIIGMDGKARSLTAKTHELLSRSQKD